MKSFSGQDGVNSLPMRSNNLKADLVMRIVKGMGWTFVGAAAGKVLTATCSIILARLLGPKDFGQFGIVQSTVLMFATYGGFRMGGTALKYVAQYRESDPAKAARILRVALSVSAALLALVATVVATLSFPIAHHTLKAPELKNALVIGAIYLFFSSYGTIVQQALGGFESFRAMSQNAILRGALMIVFCLPLGYFWGLEGALVGLALAAATVLVQAVIYLRREQRRFAFPQNLPFRETLAEWPVLWQFALPSFLALAVMTATNWMVRVMLTRQASFADLGIFEAAGQWVAVLYFIPTILARVVMPMLSANDGANDHQQYQRTLSIQIRTILLVTGPATVLMLGMGSWVVVLYGNRYAGTERIMPLLFVAGFLRTLSEACRIVYESKGRQWAGLHVYLVWGGLYIGLASLLLSRFGPFGLAASALLAESAFLALSAAQIHFRLVPGGLRQNAGLFIQMLGLVMLGCVALSSLQPVWSSTVCFILACVAGLPLLQALRRSILHHSAIQKLRDRLFRACSEPQ